jgi:hypothetical protein
MKRFIPQHTLLSVERSILFRARCLHLIALPDGKPPTTIQVRYIRLLNPVVKVKFFFLRQPSPVVVEVYVMRQTTLLALISSWSCGFEAATQLPNALLRLR